MKSQSNKKESLEMYNYNICKKILTFYLFLILFVNYKVKKYSST